LILMLIKALSLSIDTLMLKCSKLSLLGWSHYRVWLDRSLILVAVSPRHLLRTSRLPMRLWSTQERSPKMTSFCSSAELMTINSTWMSDTLCQSCRPSLCAYLPSSTSDDERL
jgi:hypothetical protein